MEVLEQIRLSHSSCNDVNSDVSLADLLRKNMIEGLLLQRKT